MAKNLYWAVCKSLIDDKFNLRSFKSKQNRAKFVIRTLMDVSYISADDARRLIKIEKNFVSGESCGKDTYKKYKSFITKPTYTKQKMPVYLQIFRFMRDNIGNHSTDEYLKVSRFLSGVLSRKNLSFECFNSASIPYEFLGRWEKRLNEITEFCGVKWGVYYSPFNNDLTIIMFCKHCTKDEWVEKTLER